MAKLAAAAGPPQEGPIDARAATADDRRWQSVADDLTFNEFPRVQMVAEKWAGTVGTLTGILSVAVLVKGPQDIGTLPLAWRVAAGIGLVLALVSASIAVYKAALAAQGLPVLVYAESTILQALYRNAAIRATERLQCSRGLAVFTVVCVAFAVAVTWWVTPMGTGKPATTLMNVLVVRRSGDVVCGTLQSATRGGLALKPKGDSRPAIPLTDVTTVITTAACP